MTSPNETIINRVIGYPLKQTQSPVLHNAVYQYLGINAQLLAVAGADLPALIQDIKRLSVPLTAVTLPYKEAVLPFLDYCSPEVTALGAANTLIQRGDRLYGYNTDIDGIAFALKDTAIQSKRVLIIGAGGAARAMAYVLKEKKAQVFYLNRTFSKAISLAKIFGGRAITVAEMQKLELDIIVNTSSVGMYPAVDESPLQHYPFHAKQLVFDMIYNPITSKLLQDAAKQEAATLSGLDMFIGQGLKQIELWSGKRLSNPKLINALRKMLIDNQRLNQS